MRKPTLVVMKVVRDHDRTLLYGEREGFHLIGTRDVQVEVGDTVRYEPYGVNFGWLIEGEENTDANDLHGNPTQPED